MWFPVLVGDEACPELRIIPYPCSHRMQASAAGESDQQRGDVASMFVAPLKMMPIRGDHRPTARTTGVASASTMKQGLREENPREARLPRRRGKFEVVQQRRRA